MEIDRHRSPSLSFIYNYEANCYDDEANGRLI